MTIKSILYASNSNNEFSPSQLEELEALAYESNLILGVSGYLYFENGIFIQYIEGPAPVLDELFARISADQRHEVFKSVVEETLSERRFPSWSMRWLTKNQLTEIKLENLIIDQMKIMCDLGNNGPDFTSSAMRIVDSISRQQNKLPTSSAAPRTSH